MPRKSPRQGFKPKTYRLSSKRVAPDQLSGNCLNCQRRDKNHSIVLCNHCIKWLDSGLFEPEETDSAEQWGEVA